MRIRRVFIIITLFLILALEPPTSGVQAFPIAQVNPSSGSFGDPADLYLEYSISGVDFSQDTDGNTFFEGQYTGGEIHFSGTLICTRAEGYKSFVTLRAQLGDQIVEWPPEGESDEVSGETVELPFDLSFKAPKDYMHTAVAGSASVTACGGVCDSYDISFYAYLPTPEPGQESDPFGVGEEDDDDEGGFPWGLAIGAGLLGGGGVAAAAALVIAKALSQGKKPKEGEPMGYVLQVSEDTIMVNEQQPASLTVTAHRVDPGGATAIAPEVQLDISVGPNGQGLTVMPKSGAGQLTCTVSLSGPPSTSQTTLTVTGRARGSSYTATVQVRMEAYRIEFI